MTLDEGLWRLWRDEPDPFPQRFEGRIEDGGRTIAGRWEKALDGTTWAIDFDLTYRKTGQPSAPSANARPARPASPRGREGDRPAAPIPLPSPPTPPIH